MMISTGAGTPASDWDPIVDRLRAVGHVFSYERAGMGWSDGGPWRPDATRTVNDLHRVLQELRSQGIDGPWILIGHSLGGLFVRQFAGRFPDRVAGLVLVDPTHEELLRRGRAVFGRKAMAAQMAMTLVYVGFPRSVARLVLALGGLTFARKLVGGATDEDVRRNVSLYLRSGFRRSYFSEMASVPAIARDLLADPPVLGSSPVAVVTAAPPEDPSSLMGRFRKDWLEMHEAIARSSSRSVRLTADRGGHFIYKDDPDTVIKALNWTSRQGAHNDLGHTLPTS